MKKLKYFYKKLKTYLEDPFIDLLVFMHIKPLNFISNRCLSITHDLGLLLDRINELGYEVHDEVYRAAEYSTLHYTLARYPRCRTVQYSERKGLYCIEAAGKIINCIKSILHRSERRTLNILED